MDPVLWYAAKFDESGNVREGWSNETYLRWFWENVRPFPTRDCHTVTKP